MRIVIATPFYPPQLGVLAMYAAGLEQAFRKAGHEVIVVSFSQGLPPGMRHVVYFLRVFLALRGARFVLALDTWSVGMPVFYAAQLRRIPFTVRLGGDFLWESYLARTDEPVRLSDFYRAPRSYSFKERMIFRTTKRMLAHAHALFFTTRFQKDIWRAAYSFPEERAFIVENFFPSVVGTYLPAKGPILVSAGRELTLKNLSLLQRIVARLTDTHPGLTLDTRLLPPEQHMQRLAMAHAIIIPSVSEVCSNTAIDAVSLGKPFICTEDTGTKERLADCGLFVDTRSEAALTEAVESILDPHTYERLASAVRAFSFTHSWDDIAQEMLASI